jgi:PrgI family protein
MTPPDPDTAARARMPADVDAPDKVLYGLTFRQLAILAVAAVICAAGWHLLHPLLPPTVLVIAAIPLGGVVFAVAVDRRDGLPLDVWLTHAIRYQRAPHALSTNDTPTTLPTWIAPPPDRVPLPAPLRLPADAIDDDGTITLTSATAATSGGERAVIVAATTVNLTLRTPAEQTALLDTFGRWLNSLTVPTQIVVANQPVDLQSAADTLTTRAAQLSNPALAAACADHADFLTRLAHRRDPLRRQVLITTRATGPDHHTAHRHAEHTARSLTALGLSARTLDAPAVTTALAGSADPYRTPHPGRQTPPNATITGPQAGIWRTTP